MIPNFFILGKEISPYMLAALAGVLVTVLYISHLADKNKLDEYRVTIMLVLAFGFGLIGAHLLYGIVEQDRKSTRLNSSHATPSRMPSSA